MINFIRGYAPYGRMHGGVVCPGYPGSKLRPDSIVIIWEESHAAIPISPEDLYGTICIGCMT